MKKEVSVIIPAYNEAERIRRTLEEVSGFLRSAGWKYEIIVVNDGSKDRTADEVRAAASGIREIVFIDRSVNKGKGETVKEGIARARYEIALFMDADNSTSIREWAKFAPLFEAGSDVVIASRHLPASRIVHPQPASRRFLGAGYRSLSRFLFGLGGRTDFNCGFKAYKTELAKRVFAEVRMTDWTFDVEVFCLLKREGARIDEVPVEWRHEDKQGGPIVPIPTALKSLQSLIKLKTRF